MPKDHRSDWFLYLLYAMNSKICNILYLNEPFLRIEPEWQEKCCQMGRIGSAI